MINGLEGIPGSGKSYEAVAYHVLPMLQAGRKVITNLPLVLEMFAAIDPAYLQLIELRRKPARVLGTWDPDGIDDKGNGEAFKVEPGKNDAPPQGAKAFGTVWCYYTTWKHPHTGQGPVFIIDECHVSLPRTGTAKEVVEWYKLHRHFNADVLLMTQKFRGITTDIADLMAMLIRCREASIIGEKGSYIRKVHAGFRGAEISKEVRKYKPEYFKLYKSHTQGNSVAESAASDVAPLSVKLRRFTWAFWIFTAVVIAWMFWPTDKAPKLSKAQAAKLAKAQQQEAIAQGPAQPPAALKPVSHIQAPETPKGPPEPDPDSTPEPFASKGLHLTGRITMRGEDVYTFAVSNGSQRISNIDSRDLAKMGYKWAPLTDCAGTLRWEGKPKAITCDAPVLAQGAQDRPVVVEAGHSKYSAGGSAAPAQVNTLPMPEFHREQPGQITQADLTASLRLKNPAYSTGRSSQ